MDPLMSSMMAFSALSAVGTSFSQANALKAEGTYRQSVANTNAKLANLTDTQTLAAGDIAASQRNLATKQAVGKLRAAQGGSGTDVNVGTNALTQIGEDFAGKVDELTIRNNAARQAWGYQTQAISDTFEGQFAKMTASSEAQQTLLTGGLQAIEGPLGIYAKSQYYQRWMGGAANPGGKPFPTVNN